MSALTFAVPIEVRSANKIKGHPMKLARITKAERRTVYFAAHSAGIGPWRAKHSPPYLCTLRRVVGPGRRLYDKDNLERGFKAIRDEIAALLGVKDGPNDPVTWVVEQVRGGREECQIVIDSVAPEL